jgi:pimeloyl-ACP methyl ester carboxylesterase
MAGLLIFVESIRWAGHRWGLRSVQAGVRAAGFRGEVLPWQWHSSRRGWLVLPATMHRSRIEQQAQRLAEFITTRRHTHPAEPLHVLGYSFGGYIALRALELLPAGIQVDSAALLAGAFSPRRDLTAACRAVTHSLVIVSSLCDAAIIGMGTLLFGAADGTHSLCAGMVGTRWRGSSKPVRIHWRPSMIRQGYLGGHFSVAAAGFIATCIAPAMRLAGPCRGSLLAPPE